MGIDQPRKDVKNIFVLSYTATGEAFEYEGDVWEAVPEDFELGVRFSSLMEQLLANGALKAHPVDLREGGWTGIVDGMRDMKEGKVSGVKLVYRVGEGV